MFSTDRPYDFMIADLMCLYYKNEYKAHSNSELLDGILEDVNFAKSKINAKKVMFVSDIGENPEENGSGNGIRHRLYPEYKAGRKHKRNPDVSRFDIVKSVSAHYPVMYAIGYEADDLACHIHKRYPDKRIAFYSLDKDWYRVISDNHVIVRNLHHLVEMTNRRKASEEMGFEISEDRIVIWKALFGDSSDNIPRSYKGIVSTKLKPMILGRWADGGDVSDLISRHSDKDRFELNLKLVSALPLSDSEIRVLKR